jgi:hypothetical protein
VGIKTKALGNALAKKLRGFEDTTSNQVAPGNMPAPPDAGLAPDVGAPVGPEVVPPAEAQQVGGAAPVTVPPDVMPDAVAGDTYTVESVTPQGITLVKQPGAAPEAAAPVPPQ